MKKFGAPYEHNISMVEARLMMQRVFKVAQLLAGQLPEFNGKCIEDHQQNRESPKLKYRETSDQTFKS